MDIRRARPGDIPQLLALIRRYWDFEGIEGFAALRIELVLKELLEGPVARGSIWVAEAHGALAGYLIVVLVMSVEHQGLMGEIDEFFVLPEARARHRHAAAGRSRSGTRAARLRAAATAARNRQPPRASVL